VLGCTPFPQESAGHVLEISTPAGAEPIIIIPPRNRTGRQQRVLQIPKKEQSQ
jgi:hypothetical protein